MRTQTQRQAEAIQYHWNCELTHQQRDELYARFSERLERAFEELGLTVMCHDCLCRFCEDTFTDWDDCPECGSWDLDGYRGNPVLQLQAAQERDREERYEGIWCSE